MKSTAKCLILLVTLGALLLCASAPMQGQSPQGWQKITGQRFGYIGMPDGIMPDALTGGVSQTGRENSYAWSMEFHGGYLYLGTSRDIVGLVLSKQSPPPDPWPTDVPVPTDVRGRIFRMNLYTGRWEHFYTAPSISSSSPFTVGPDLGYRAMKTYKAPYANPVLYVGCAGLSSMHRCRLLAIDSQNHQPVQVFQTSGFSVRGIAIHNNQLFWASEVGNQPAIWYSTNPLKEYQNNNSVAFPRIDVPSDWFPEGAEIFDMVSYNGSLYVFFLNHDIVDAGFWCAKLSKVYGAWKWKLIVGNTSLGAKYPRGMGRWENGAATPFVFKNKVYVGTLSTTMGKFLGTGQVDIENIPPLGAQLFRFDIYDKWERVVPAGNITDPEAVAFYNGFSNPLNLYIWRFGEQNGTLYAGTFDVRSALEAVGGSGTLPPLPLWNPGGFDLYKTTDGVKWVSESVNGFGDPYNYGARTLITNPQTGDLYLGTANPFYGCQIWRKRAGY